MNNKEFSTEFDIRFNNIMSNQAPGVNEYEKSVFLTRAQNEIVRNYFNPKGNKYNAGFDSNEKRQTDFSMLINTIKPEQYSNNDYIRIDRRSILYTIPMSATDKEIMCLLNETAQIVSNGKTIDITIVPISYIEYQRLMKKPFNAPFKNQGWRLMSNSTYSDTDDEHFGTREAIAEIVANIDQQSSGIPTPSNMTNYIIRYVRKPKPIILIDLKSEYGDEMTIDGKSGISTCELDPEIHSEILQRAVEIAKITYMGDTKDMIEIGTRTE